RARLVRAPRRAPRRCDARARARPAGGDVRARLRGASPLYLVAAAMFVVTLAVAALGTRSDQTGLVRSGSVYDEGPGGPAVLRRWLEDIGIATRVVQGDELRVDDDDRVVLV